MATNSRQLNIILNLQDRASAELNTFKSKVESMQPMFQKMAIAGTVAFTGIAMGVKKMTQNASDLQESINAVNVVFGDGAENILKFGENSARSVGLARSEFNQMATVTGALFKDVELPMEEVADMTTELALRASDMASVFNTDVKDAMSAINQAIRGETEAIRRYAGDVTDATLQQYLFSIGVDKSTKELTEQEKRLYRVELLMKQTEVTAGDFANTSDGLANRLRILKAEIKNTSAELGLQFVPIAEKVLERIDPIVKNITAWIKENPKLASNIILVAGALAWLVAILGTLGLILPFIITGFTLLLSPWALLAIALALVIGLIIKFKDEIVLFFQKIDENLHIVDFLKEKWQELKTIWDEQVRPALKSLYDLFVAFKPVFDLMLKVVGVLLKVAFMVLIGIVKGFINTLMLLLGEGSRIFKFFVTMGGHIDKVTNAITKAIEKVEKLIEKFRELGVIKNIRSRAQNIVETVGDVIGVNDAVITPDGKVIKTNPADYLFATKTPEDLMGGKNNDGGSNIINININGGIFGSDAGEEIGDMIIERLGIIAKL